ncbi:MAG: 30S ribosome-binding factor RbfA [Fidelibacterota bacterium]
MRVRPYSRAQRYGHELQKILGEIILKEVDTSRVGLATVTGVKVSNDLRLARVYVSVLDRKGSQEDVERFFTRRAKFIRRMVGAQVTSKSVPELRFHYDSSFEEAEKVNRLLTRIQRPESESK